MKLSTTPNLSMNDPIKLELKKKDGTSYEPNVFLTVYSLDSKVGKAAQNAGFRDMLALRESNEAILNEEDVIINGMVIEKKGEPKSEIVMDASAKTISRLIIDWEGVEDEDGNAISYDYETATSLLKNNEDFFHAVNVLVGSTGKQSMVPKNASQTTPDNSDTTILLQTKTTKRVTKKAATN